MPEESRWLYAGEALELVTGGGMRLRWVGMLGEDTQGKSVSLLEM